MDDHHVYDTNFTEEINNKMQVPKSIRVNGDVSNFRSTNYYSDDNSRFGDNFDMRVPEKIILIDQFTDDDIIGNAILLFAAGAETTSSMVSFCLYELALNKEIQDKLRAEIYSMRAKHDGQFNNDFLMDLRYTNMVLEETGRKYSITSILMREATKTYTLPDESFVIEKGQKLIIPMFSIHRDPKYYPDPLVFDPERFSKEQKSQRPNGTYMPFGDGPRVCIGKRFAELEMKLVLSNVLSKFEVLPCEETEIPLEITNETGVMAPKRDLVLKFRPIIEN